MYVSNLFFVCSNLAACYIDYLSGDESDTDGPGGRSKEQEDEGLKLQRAFRHLGIRVSANQGKLAFWSC